MWYHDEEGREEGYDPWGGSSAYIEAKEEKVVKEVEKRVSAQRRQLNEDQDRWERNRMLVSGAVQSTRMDDEIMDEDEERVCFFAADGDACCGVVLVVLFHRF